MPVQKGCKRGSYSKSVVYFPEKVATPATEEDLKVLSKQINLTREKIRRWEGSQPENCQRAKAFLKLQEAARAACRHSQSPEDVRSAARAGKEALYKQAAKVSKEVAKFLKMGGEGFELAEESNHTDASLVALKADAETVVAEAAAAHPFARPSRKRKVVDAEKEAIEKETEEQLAAIASGKAPVA